MNCDNVTAPCPSTSSAEKAVKISSVLCSFYQSIHLTTTNGRGKAKSRACGVIGAESLFGEVDAISTNIFLNLSSFD